MKKKVIIGASLVGVSLVVGVAVVGIMILTSLPGDALMSDGDFYPTDEEKL